MLTPSSLILSVRWEHAGSIGSGSVGRGETGIAGSSGSSFTGRCETDLPVVVDLASLVAVDLDSLCDASRGECGFAGSTESEYAMSRQGAMDQDSLGASW